jgi:pimeloyl-ACP methyl ester carboxylesterase
MSIEGHKIVAISYNEDQSAPPVVFIHGIMSSVYAWSVAQTPIINERFRWYSLSLPGHYPAMLPSGFQREELTAEAIARVLTTAIRQLVGDQPVILAGHSTGGFAVLDIAAHTPDIAFSVISISGFVHGRWTGVLGILQRLARLGPIGRALFRANLKVLTSSYAIYRASTGFYAADRQALYAWPELESALRTLFPYAQHLDRNAMLHYFERMPNINIGPLLPQIRAPTLALSGDSDPIVPPDQSQLIAANVADGELVSFEGAGHMPMCERPAHYHDAITKWMEKVA